MAGPLRYPWCLGAADAAVEIHPEMLWQQLLRRVYVTLLLLLLHGGYPSSKRENC